MKRSDVKSVDGYLAAQPKEVQPILKQVRGAIRKALPKADEVISYQIPAYKMFGSAVIYFAGFKDHYSLYPVNTRLVAAFKEELAPYEQSGRGTVRFPYAKRVPVGLIGRLAKFLAGQAAERAAAKKARAKKR